MPRQLPRRVGDVLKFDRKVKIGHTGESEGAHQNSRFLLVEKVKVESIFETSKFKWRLRDIHTGVLYTNLWRPRYLVKDVFLTKAYRASRKSDLIPPQPLAKEPEVKEILE